MTTNEAAERLLKRLAERCEAMGGYDEWGADLADVRYYLPKALAAERRATVEWILDALQHDHAMFVRVQLIGNRILDAEVSVVSTDSQQADR